MRVYQRFFLCLANGWSAGSSGLRWEDLSYNDVKSYYAPYLAEGRAPPNAVNKLCLDTAVEARYWGETSRSAYCRTLEHMKAIESRDEKNAFSKHISLHHPEEEGNKEAFKFSLVELHKQPLPRLTSESCYIHMNTADL